jgi:predicted RNA-binding protein with TRAM domain
MYKQYISAMFSILLLVALTLAQTAIVRAAPGDTSRVSVSSSGAESNGDSYHAAISADGRYIAFESDASTLTSGDTNGWVDIFVRDTQTGTTTRVSVDSSGNEANSDSYSPSISADGRYVAFESYADNLVINDTNWMPDVFVHDMQTGTTIRVSVASNGDEANDGSYMPKISANGRYVTFESDADNLVSGDTNAVRDIFVHDLQTGTTTRVSIAWNGNQANSNSYVSSISADGRYVAFQSDASNLVSGDTNGFGDIFVRDTQSGTTTRISIDSSGNEANNDSYEPAISGDGRYVAFWSYASNLVSGDNGSFADIFLHDTQSGTTTRISIDSSGNEANNNSYGPAISGDGHYVVFHSYASNLVSGDTNVANDIFLHDTQTGSTMRISLDSSRTEANSDSYYPAISSDGLYVAFESYADNLVSSDTNNSVDIFLHENDLIQPAVSSLLRADPNPTSTASVNYTVTFSEDVTGVDASDFSLTVTGAISGASVTGVSGSGATYTVTVDTGTGNGTLRLDVPASATITDLTGNPLSGLPYTGGEVYDVDKTTPTVVSILRADPNPTSAASVNFTVTFSEDVTGVDASDFSLTVTGAISGASVTGVSGSGATYTVTVDTGTGNGTLRLDVPASATITDLTGNLLSGLPYTGGEAYDVQKNMSLSFTSIAAQDGWILESTETSNTGGSLNNTATSLYLGDDAANRQYRTVLSFNTASLPDNAVITKVTLKLKLQGIVGTTPFNTHGNLLIDVRKGPFGSNAALQLTDFQATASQNAIGALPKTPVSGWYTRTWTTGSIFSYINKTGVTQFRLRFAKDDNNDNGADFLKFYSANATAAVRPQLIIEYYVP